MILWRSLGILKEKGVWINATEFLNMMTLPMRTNQTDGYYNCK